MELEEFSLEDTFELVIKDAYGVPTDVIFTVYGDHTYHYEQSLADVVSMGESKDRPIVLLAKMVKEVAGLTVNGNPFDLSEESMIELLKSKRLIMKQVDEAVYKRSNFTKG